MGWASYFEDNIEKVLERAFMSRSFCATRDHPAVITKSMPIVRPIVTLSVVSPPALSAAENRRQIRDTHVLCFEELRPRMRSEFAGRL
jgi:hypothetical protein